ncbi:MAG: ATP synthase F1 subunit delta [Oscillospiraceae bacterium]|nr:ATP synthase F1 subunit delta [Oscillospiraceae bacterium]
MSAMTDIAKEYGAALFLLAREEQQEAEYSSALAQIREVFAENPEYLEMLASPGIPLGERLSAIEAAFANAVPEHMLSYLQLLCEKGRISAFSDAAEEYFALYDASRRVSNAVVTSAVPLTDAQKQTLQQKLEAMCKGTVTVEYRLDASLLGGLVVELDGKIMDGSLRHRLQQVKDVMTT